MTNISVAPSTTLLTQLTENIEVIQPIPAQLDQIDGAYVARFVEANVNASGDTWLEAQDNLKMMIADVFDFLRSQPKAKLATGPMNQLTALELFIRQRVNA